MAENDPNIEKPAPRLLRSTSIVGGMTLLSRILGLARDIVFARFFGAGVVMDAFFVAFKIPNIFRRFFAEIGESPSALSALGCRAETERAVPKTGRTRRRDHRVPKMSPWGHTPPGSTR